MPAHSPRAPTGPFIAHDYQIEFSGTGAPEDVDIRARAAEPLRVGDHYTIGGPDGLYDLVVETISYSTEGWWRARCRVADLGWLGGYQ